MGWIWIGPLKDASGDPIPDPPSLAQTIAELNHEGVNPESNATGRIDLRRYLYPISRTRS